ncbi:hypothetical protein PV08_04409 [Exophiala spinifera]|uniref:Amidohydrolase-related domain-containing protein n=1 Tax=Exophiala spinifera TaxID=91928 RepID=A0A0D2BE18_9EURO|nr:uncharacterized protein PV08_04409 [Exophiala spinifera]KIW17218.1 hypothetical protein PV08_04409 [Exophiala spinifera]
MSSFAIKNVRIFDGDNVLEDADVIVKDGIIEQVGPDLNPGDLPSISTPGYTLLPGLIDAHCHPDRELRLLEQSFRFGITTIMDMHNVHENAVQLKRWAQARKDVPDVKSCHYAATIKGGWPAWVEMKLPGIEPGRFDNYPNVNSEEAAEAYIQKAVEGKYDYIKLMHEDGRALGIAEGQIEKPTEAVQEAVVRAAHKRGLKVVGHALSLEDTREILRAGVDGLAHTFFDEPMTPEIIELHRRNNVWVNPTLACAGALTGESLDIFKQFSEDDRVKNKLSTGDIELMHHCLHLKAPGAKWEYAIDSVRQLRAAGTDIICGSDAAAGAPGSVFGANLHIEMYLLVMKAGLPAQEVLRGATSLTADLFGWNDRGRIAEGLKADLLLVEGNPLSNITDTLNIRAIWRDGVKFEGHQGFPQH